MQTPKRARARGPSPRTRHAAAAAGPVVPTTWHSGGLRVAFMLPGRNRDSAVEPQRGGDVMMHLTTMAARGRLPPRYGSAAAPAGTRSVAAQRAAGG